MRIPRRFAILPEVEDFFSPTPSLSVGVAHALPGGRGDRRPRSGVARAVGPAMPRYYEDKPEGGACAGVKEDLGACLLQSACVLQVADLGG